MTRFSKFIRKYGFYLFIGSFAVIMVASMTKSSWTPYFEPKETIRNEIPIEMYAEEDQILEDYERKLMIEWSKGVNNFCTPSVIEWFWTKYQNVPKVKNFMIAATKSSNGFDDNDCVSLAHITTEVDAEQKLSEKRKDLKKLEATIKEQIK